MLEDFKIYLVKNGYSEFTPSGNPSTAYDYKKRVEKIHYRENVTLNKFIENIDFYIDKYGHTGSESEFGKKSHNAFINALKRFKEFLNQKTE
ncbi:hypothetical protein LNI90_11900 [Tenacibaculum dicentrarchi]|uniref:Uncharacterized protein n=1 Tax=Tenacibaculum finnmarkense genomovar finnmarkense TaxID=1458503 RepID=A0AAP1RH73_9FLAO|nr:hypothetical protein [Tenacibaculum finnmarkense]MCD8416150.1 hypothetical protein [Tenacibaculum dicentrarchi]MBE7653953.1 hypothetical protein [Tenacibaculum finnmarkense genomovar finnmarkense]MBE7689077.1 hypothetical protein [Tenacibaculum finnmarkense genomovar ulcerans]MBE7696245.1 hypothetical protein [Tenacibaculum finnmarkense genomovar finnmarkense]MCD8421268.1 hypothetical protein [Tenacibaculum dicentrarchi]